MHIRTYMRHVEKKKEELINNKVSATLALDVLKEIGIRESASPSQMSGSCSNDQVFHGDLKFRKTQEAITGIRQSE